MKKSLGPVKYLVKNKKAHFLYNILERYEAGIALTGTEVKSIRAGSISLADSYCKVQNQELYILNLNISPYRMGGYANHKPLRKRKLLMHQREILKLHDKLILKGYTLVPMAIYLKRGWIKMELGLARGRQKEDKREYLKQKDAKREIRNFMDGSR